MNILSLFHHKRPGLDRAAAGAAAALLDHSRAERLLLARFRRLPRRRQGLLLEMARRLDSGAPPDSP